MSRERANESRPVELPPRDCEDESAFHRALVRRERWALERFYERYFSRIWNLVRSMTADRDQAEDLVQDVFLNVYSALPSFEPERELFPWVQTIARNRVRDHWRARGRQRVVKDEPTERISVDEEPEDAADRQEVAAQLREAVDWLPNGTRSAVRLRIYDDLSFEEVARRLPCNEAAARKRFSRGLALLRERLTPSSLASR